MYFTDYDECNPPENIHIPDCGPNAICTNLDLTYNCTCLEGYIGNGINCAGKILYIRHAFCFFALAKKHAGADQCTNT
jgi:hypothetical protein